jgi:hypothetical protein
MEKHNNAKFVKVTTLDEKKILNKSLAGISAVATGLTFR